MSFFISNKKTLCIVGAVCAGFTLFFVLQDPIDKHLIGNWYGFLFNWE